LPINYNERIEEFEELIENVETLSASTPNDYFKLLPYILNAD
jgi:hypothetical protein